VTFGKRGLPCSAQLSAWSGRRRRLRSRFVRVSQSAPAGAALNTSDGRGQKLPSKPAAALTYTRRGRPFSQPPACTHGWSSEWSPEPAVRAACMSPSALVLMSASDPRPSPRVRTRHRRRRLRTRTKRDPQTCRPPPLHAESTRREHVNALCRRSQRSGSATGL